MILDYVPVCCPLLPPADLVAEYIRRADARRHYTNRGALACLLEERLAEALGRPGHAVRSASSGTSAIEAAILATAGMATPDRPFALLPAFTFAASAIAVERCGFRPVFVDIDPATWTLDLAAVRAHPLLAQTGLILAVGPYGVLPDIRALEALQEGTGVQVVVDAAAAFEALLDAPRSLSQTVPVTVSFHATKTFSTGEGGAVLWDNAEGQARVVQVSNFGFRGTREALSAGTNAKLSEYHAAVGLAMLDGFAARRAEYARVAGDYCHLASGSGRQGRALGGRLHLPPAVSSAYVLFEAATAPGMDRAEAALLARRVETRRWYGRGVHVQSHFAPPGGLALPATTDLCHRLLGLPMAPDMTAADIALTLDILEEAAALPGGDHGLRAAE